MWCLLPPAYQSQGARNTSNTFLGCLKSIEESVQGLQANTWYPCKAKIGKSEHGTPMPTYKGLKKKYHSSNHALM